MRPRPDGGGPAGGAPGEASPLRRSPERIPGVRAAEERHPLFLFFPKLYPAALAYPAVLCYYRAVGASAPARPVYSGRTIAKSEKKKGGFCVRTRASKLLSLILAAALCLSLTVTVSAAETGAGQEGPVTILYTNDIHTYIDNNVGEGNENGLTYSKVAGYKDSLDGALLVDAGDAIQGTAYGSMDEGATITKLMNAAGYDAATLGNHEFDYDMEGCLAAIERRRIPLCLLQLLPRGERRARRECAGQLRGAGGRRREGRLRGHHHPRVLHQVHPRLLPGRRGQLHLRHRRRRGRLRPVRRRADRHRRRLAEADYVIALGHLGVDPSSRPGPPRRSSPTPPAWTPSSTATPTPPWRWRK